MEQTNYNRVLRAARDDYRSAISALDAVTANIELNGSTPRREKVRAHAETVLEYQEERLHIVIDTINDMFRSRITIDTIDDVLQENIA